MKLLPRRALLLACLAIPTFGCQSAPAESRGKAYTLVFLVTGPKSAAIDADHKKEIFEGHMANIRRLADEDKLLIAGPFGKEKPDAALRGIFILDTPDVATARAWTETDPGVKAGEFSAEYATLRTEAVLRRSLDLWREMEKKGETTGAPSIRGYVMVLSSEPRTGTKVCFEGTLEGSKRGRHLAVLDAEDVGAVTSVARDGVASWYSVKTVAEIPGG
jgi:uncharacterized protein YciI